MLPTIYPLVAMKKWQGYDDMSPLHLIFILLLALLLGVD